ncbi:hypothetical protein [Stakelama saccharophila]|uniref:Uncharacterized protein n=1 Tax=Stakelama saccharophila TaxID=3075605 RepID=A0ABZ0B7R7_9SPHN|nr:hypothetical protein [Stakelama sp. W311]WNO52646.1 hypothetical protein RPR59_09215 [Stakelama sp. W311]
MTNLMREPILPENESAANVLAPTNSAQAAGEASADRLQPIVYNDIESLGLLGPGCSFHAEQPDATLAIVTNDAEGAVKIDDDFRKLTARKAGEEYVTRGPILEGEEALVIVTRSEGAGRLIGIDTRGWPASMRVAIGDRAERTYQGEWQCGA